MSEFSDSDLQALAEKYARRAMKEGFASVDVYERELRNKVGSDKVQKLLDMIRSLSGKKSLVVKCSKCGADIKTKGSPWLR